MDGRYKDKFMRKKIYSILTAISCLFCSCEKAPTIVTEDTPEFSGKMTVLYDGESFEQSGVKVSAELSTDRNTVDIMLHKVKFVPSMPVRIDVTIMDVPVIQSDGGTWTFAGDDITPWAMGGYYDTYRVDDLYGTISENAIELSLDFFNTKKGEGYPTSYSGRK